MTKKMVEGDEFRCEHDAVSEAITIESGTVAYGSGR